MSDLLSMQVLLWMGEAIAASSLILALAWLTAARNTASQRHLVWFASFVALAALPVLAAIVPARITYMLAGPAIPVTQGFGATAIASLPEPPGFTFDTATVVEMLIALWLLGVVLIAVRGLVAAFALYNLRRNSVPHRFGHLAIDGPRCDLRLAQEDCGPMTWGIFRPVVLLPADAETWPHSRLEAVLLHELAHVRRHDSLTQLASLVVCALYWPNPLVWLAAARLRREAETAADDAVLIAGVRPSDYAGELLQIASEFRVQRLSLPLAMAAPSALEARVKSVLEPNKSRSGVTTMDVFKIACLAAMATTAIAFARPSLAQDAPRVESTPLPAPQATSAPDTDAVATDDQDQQVVGSDGRNKIYKLSKPKNGTMEIMSDRATMTPRTHTWVYSGKVTIRGKHVDLRSVDDLSPAERARVDAAVAQARASVKDIEPEVARAMEQARVQMAREHVSQEQVRVALVQAQKAIASAHLDETVAKALKDAHIEENVARAMKNAHIDATVATALAKAQRALEAANEEHGAVVIDDEAAPPPPPPTPEAAPPAPPATAPAVPEPPAPPAPPSPQN